MIDDNMFNSDFLSGMMLRYNQFIFTGFSWDQQTGALLFLCTWCPPVITWLSPFSQRSRDKVLLFTPGKMGQLL